MFAAGSARSNCRGDTDAPPVDPAGLDFHQILAIKNELRREEPPTLPQTRPALILHGECDFVQAAVSQDYRHRLNAEIEEIPHRPHFLWAHDAPAVRASIVSFLSRPN